MNIIYTAIFGPYEQLKEPTVVTPGWRYVCYTDQPFVSSVWEIRRVGNHNITDNNSDRYRARFYKIVASIGATRSIWVDGSFTINCNLNDWWTRHFKSPMTCIKHPIRDCIYEEAEAVVKNGRGGAERVLSAVKRYGIPAHAGLIQSGIIMREHTPEVNKFCRAWWDETVRCLRDQISFAYVAYNSTLPVHYIEYDYRTGQEFLFTSHYKKQPA